MSNSYEFDICPKGIVKHYSYPGMPPQFQALRVPVKQSWEAGTVLAPYKPFSIRSRGGRIPRLTPQSLVRITPFVEVNSMLVYANLNAFFPPLKSRGDPASVHPEHLIATLRRGSA